MENNLNLDNYEDNYDNNEYLSDYEQNDSNEVDEIIISGHLLYHYRENVITGTLDYFFPQEIKDPADKEYARLQGLEIGWTLLGFRIFEAIMIPCKRQSEDGTFIDTPSEDQHRIYLSLIRDEMNKQEEMKQDGRCNISDGRGHIKRCPLRIPNPNYVPELKSRKNTKTIKKDCKDCPFERFKQAHTTIAFSTLDHKDEGGEVDESFEAASPRNYYEGERYERLRAAFLKYVEEHDVKLTDLADLLTQEYNRSEAARELGVATSTAGSQKKLLKELCRQFLDSTIIM